jgi:cellulose synthase/poly-beta-1,6-N-acetylglucosamine synthase-like glycosyltransferase
VQSLLVGAFKLSSLLGRWRPRLRILGTNVPSVDILIPICKEKLDIVQDTVCAALNIDYPQNRFRVVVTDDGMSAGLRCWVNKLSAQFPNLHYTAREAKGGFKAGNLNHAYDFLGTLPGGRSEFLAGLDADMIPERKWLRAMIPHIVQNPKLGVVCPTQVCSQEIPPEYHWHSILTYCAQQLFYNIPKNDPLLQSRLSEWSCLNILSDLTTNGWNTGSGWIIRPDALEDIGGFPEDCIIEDVYSTFLMQAEGWESAYVPETVQFGLVPTSYLAHLKQFTRWVSLIPTSTEHANSFGVYRWGPNRYSFQWVLG